MFDFDSASMRHLRDMLRLAREQKQLYDNIGIPVTNISSQLIPQVDPALIRTVRMWAEHPSIKVSQQIYGQASAGYKLVQQYNDLAAAYKRLRESVTTPLPSDVLDLAALDVYTLNRSVRILASPEGDREPEFDASEELAQTISYLRNVVGERLSEIGLAYAAMWVGAQQSSQSQNPDRVRHVMISLRTLLVNLLDKLAPSTAVREWDAERTPEYWGENNKVKRKGQLYFLCRDIKNRELSPFLEENIRLVLKIARDCNSVHESTIGMSNERLSNLIDSFVAAIHFIFWVIDKGPVDNEE